VKRRTQRYTLTWSTFDAPLGQQLLDVPVREPEAEVPTHRQGDHLGREAEAGEGGAGGRDGRATAVTGHHASVAGGVGSAVNATVPPGSFGERQPGPVGRGGLERPVDGAVWTVDGGGGGEMAGHLPGEHRATAFLAALSAAPTSRCSSNCRCVGISA
jgi:hypothetical protein